MVFRSREKNQLYEVSVDYDFDSFSMQMFVEKAISLLNEQFNLTLPFSPMHFALYFAKKNGALNRNFPGKLAAG